MPKEQKPSKCNRLFSPFTGQISESWAKPAVPSQRLTTLATSGLRGVEGAGEADNSLRRLFVPVDYFLLAWVKQSLQICKPVRANSYIFTLQLFLLTSDHNFLVIGRLAPDYCLSELLYMLLGCSTFLYREVGRQLGYFLKLFSVNCCSYYFPSLHLRAENVRIQSLFPGVIIS